MDYYSLPFSFEKALNRQHKKVTLDHSVKQHILLILSVLPGQCYVSPFFGCNFQNSAFGFPAAKESQSAWRKALERSIKDSLWDTLERHEPRLQHIGGVKINSGMTQSWKEIASAFFGDRETKQYFNRKIRKYAEAGIKQYILVGVSGTLVTGAPFYFQELFPFK